MADVDEVGKKSCVSLIKWAQEHHQEDTPSYFFLHFMIFTVMLVFDFFFHCWSLLVLKYFKKQLTIRKRPLTDQVTFSLSVDYFYPWVLVEKKVKFLLKIVKFQLKIAEFEAKIAKFQFEQLHSTKYLVTWHIQPNFILKQSNFN